MGEGFAAAVAGGLDAHEAGVEGILHVAFQDAVLDQHGAAGGVALVVDVEGAAAVRQGAVVHHGDALGGDPLADAAGEGGGALAVEIALEAVADGFVQQDAGPAGAEHHGHGAGGGRTGVQVGDRLVHRLPGVALQHFFAEIAVVVAAATAGGALLPLALAAIDDDGNGDPHQGPHVGRQTAVAAGHQHHVVFTGEGGHDLGDPLVQGAGIAFQAFQQLYLFRRPEGGDGVLRQVEAVALAPLQLGRLAGLAGGADGAHRRGGIAQGLAADVVGVGEGGFLAGDGAHADALVDVEAAGFDDALLQAPGLGPAVLEVEVGIIHTVFHDLAEDVGKALLIQVVGRQQQGFGLLDDLAHGET